MIALEWDINEALQARLEDGIEKGIPKGIGIGKAEVAVNLIRMGMDFNQIQAATNLPITKIEELAAQCKKI